MISFESLLLAAHAAARGKRFKPGVARFVFDLERQLLLLHEELASKTYRPGPYRTFTIYEGKTRQISAAPFRDRVVHHALTGVLEPIFERSFIFDSYACRKGKGTHAAVDRCQQFARRYRYVPKTVKERADIAADGHPAGTPETGGVERHLPRENGQRLVGGEREEEELFALSAGIAWFGDIIREGGCSSRSGPVRSLAIRRSVTEMPAGQGLRTT